MAARFRLPCELRPFLNHRPPLLVLRMGFPGNNELYRAARIGQQTDEAFPVV